MEPRSSWTALSELVAAISILPLLLWLLAKTWKSLVSLLLRSNSCHSPSGGTAMAISYNTGAASAAPGAVIQTTGLQLTIPSGVLVDDWMFIIVGFFTWVSGASITDISCTAASGHAWTKQGVVE